MRRTKMYISIDLSRIVCAVLGAGKSLKVMSANYRSVGTLAGVAMPTIFAVVLSFGTGARSYAQGNGTPAVEALPARPAGAPPNFDKPAVVHLIDNIETGNNIVLLRWDYFGRHLEPLFPKESGFALLKGAAEEEDTGSKRWFLLESVIAYASFHIDESTRREGFAAYDQIFSRTAEAEKAKATDAAERAIYDYANIVGESQGPRRHREDEGTGAILFKALEQRLVFIRHHCAGSYDIPWARAINQTASDDRCAKLINQVLADKTFPRSFPLLVTAAGALQNVDPAKSASLFAEARQLLPRTNSQQTHAFYEQDVDAMVAQKNWTGAISAQKQLVDASGKGRARLAWLYLQAGDEASFTDTFKDLEQPDAPDAEVLQMAAILNYVSQNDPSSVTRNRSRVIELLSTYLTPGRSRNASSELDARLLLANAYVDQKEYDEAGTVLTSAVIPKEMPVVRVHLWQENVKRLMSRIDASSGTVEKKAEGGVQK